MKFLEGKTRIIATHALPYLPLFDEIIMIKKGKIIMKGTYNDIKDTEDFKNLTGKLE